MADATEDASSAPYRVEADPGNSSIASADLDPDAVLGFSIPREEASARWLSPVDVGALVVQHMKRSVAEFVGYPIYRAVICVPAKFSQNQTKATQQAFEKAGFKVMRVLEEPTAAAVAYNLHKSGAVKHVLVYDLGGGTLDTSLLYMNGRSISLLGVAGDDHLGGSDFDLRMRTLLEAKVVNSAAPEVPPMPLQGCDRNGLGIVAEEAKIKLSSADSVEVHCLADDGKARVMTVTRAEFEEACKDLFDRSMAPVEKALADQMMTADNIDDIVLVGGASRTPKIRTLLKGYLGEGKRLHTEIDPDTVVAYGAANILD
jgi:molecular chaperone DnaK (HSP70)